LGEYIVRRLALGLLTIWLVTLFVFIGLRVVLPVFYGDVVSVESGRSGVKDPVREASLRKLYGLDQPVATQYVKWAGGLVTGDLGHSLFDGRSLVSQMRSRLPVSVELGVLGLLSALFLAIPIGIFSALKQDQWPDYLVRVYAIGSTSVPSFWVAIMIITLGSIWFGWSPPLRFAYVQDDPIQHLKIMALPALIIGLTPGGGLARIMRSQMLEVLREDYVRTARAKGLGSSTVLLRHALRNSLIPIVTIVGLQLPALIAGTAIFEQIFVLPGMGNYILTSTANLDYPIIQGINVIFAFIIVISTLAVDISYGFIDPRIRYS
jgi:peptide/nickel transport system permease protein